MNHEAMTAETVLNRFLSQHVDEVVDFSHVPLEKTGLLESYVSQLNLTHFDDLYDTLLYSQLIARAITLTPDAEVVIDLGAGSSIPTLLALKQTFSRGLRVMAVDVDPKALKVSQENVSKLGFDQMYSFYQGDMQLLLDSGLMKGERSIIVSNPPYIPAPLGTHDYHLLPINGGEDGTAYLMNLLERAWPAGTTLALFWGSLSNPLKIVPAMEEKFEILHVHAVKVHFGNYTTIPEINSHLYRLREEGKVAFERDENGETQIVIGTILRAR